MKLWFIVFFALLGLGCQFRPPPKPSIIVVAVEGLDFESVPCLQGAEETQKGLMLLCQESVRFTHAYTPSVLSQPALASILSGRYPHDHRVRNNGSNYLSEKFDTLSEVALKSGYRTAFFSGGPPIWRKSGFAQGFEVFEDNIGVQLGRYYRPAQQNFKFLENWISRLRRQDPVFAMVYLADLQFPLAVTHTEAGSERSQTRESQLKAIDEAVEEFVTHLKKIGRWDQTFFVLAGLNGQNRRSVMQQISPLNLYSENGQVTLMIKPARAQRDLGIEWSVDVNVSLVDLGVTLFDLLGSALEKSADAVSFISSLERPSTSWHRDRVVSTESDWATWRGIGTLRTALRSGHWLYMHDQSPLLFNTLVDRGEINPVRPVKLAPPEILSTFQNVIGEQKLETWISPPEDVLQKIHIAKRWFEQKRLPKEEADGLFHLIRTRPWDQQVVGWGALYAIQEKNWDLLVELGQTNFRPIWNFIGRRLKGEGIEPPPDDCLDMIFKKNRADKGICKDKLFTQYVEWRAASDEVDKKIRASQFLLTFNSREIQKEVSWHNYLNDLAWDAILSIPGEPDLLDLILLMPEFRRPK